MPAKKKAKKELFDSIVLKGVKTHNLKNIDIEIPKNQITTVTGVSGSGKSSLAFHTIYKEGQFRYIESLSSYLRQFFNLGARPDLEYSEGLSPAIAIEQNKRIGNTRSTVGTLTEIDDYLRLLLAKLGDVYCYQCGNQLKPKTTEQIVDDIAEKFLDRKVYMLEEVGVFDEELKLSRWVRKNRRQVDQGGGVTRFLIALNYDDETHHYDDLVEYFYLEDPNIPDDMLPVKVFGVFDRVTINNSTTRRLKDDVIKMLGRADKFGVMSLDQEMHKSKKQNKKVMKQQQEEKKYRFINLCGYSGDPQKNFFPRLEEELTARGHRVETPTLPNPDMVNLEEKVAYVLQHAHLDEHTILIGHSLGSAVAMKALESSQVRIAGFVSVAGVYDWDIAAQVLKKEKYTPWKAYAKEYGSLDRDRGQLLGKAQVVKVLGQKKDPNVPNRHQKSIASVFDVEARLVSSADKHFTGQQEPEILTVVDELLQELEQQQIDIGGAGDTDHIERYTDKFYCAQDNIGYPEFTSQHFSANRQEGACPECHGIGEILQCDFDKVLDPYAPYLKAVLPWRDSNYGQAILKKLAEKYSIDTNQKWDEMPQRFTSVVKDGDEELLRVNTGGGKFVSMYYKGIEEILRGQYTKGVLTVDFQAMLDVRPCPSCKGAKLRPESLNVFIPVKMKQGRKKVGQNYSIFDFQSMPIEQLMEALESFIAEHDKPTELVERIVHPLLDRARTITHLGLGYIHTVRKIDSLSGGEIQRLRLAKQLGNKLTGITYVLDEPTIGLDEKEIIKVIDSIKQLKEMGNTIVVVEHNEDFIKASDWIVEVGPGAGDFGGHIVYNGSYKDFLHTETLTAQYINGEKKVEAYFDHTPSTDVVSIKKANKHNLQKIDVDINLGSFTIITGASGAGKTTLMYHTLFTFLSEKQKWIQSRIRLALLREGMSRADIIQAPIMQRKKYEHLEQVAIQEFYEHIGVETITGYETIENVLYVDQTSIGKTPRSCPATFVGVFDDIRKMFAGVTEAKMLAFNAGHFSFNSNKGACPECKGYGYKRVELQFLPDTYVPCSLCKGRRYKPEILDIRRHGKTISEVLDMYVEDAVYFFEDIEFIAEKLQLMHEIGLGYLKMGQPAHMLSGGESQRLKLVKHLLKSYKGHTVYFLDEPTVGLHPNDIERLLKVLKRFLDDGDTILMIEHEQSMLQFADKVIRLEHGKLKKGK